MISEEQQKEILSLCIQKDGGLFNLGWYIGWDTTSETATLDGQFTADDLEAIADRKSVV